MLYCLSFEASLLFYAAADCAFTVSAAAVSAIDAVRHCRFTPFPFYATEVSRRCSDTPMTFHAVAVSRRCCFTPLLFHAVAVSRHSSFAPLRARSALRKAVPRRCSDTPMKFHAAAVSRRCSIAPLQFCAIAVQHLCGRAAPCEKQFHALSKTTNGKPPNTRRNVPSNARSPIRQSITRSKQHKTPQFFARANTPLGGIKYQLKLAHRVPIQRTNAPT
jgi:hypothetical protein